jgi:hypothetical protein
LSFVQQKYNTAFVTASDKGSLVGVKARGLAATAPETTGYQSGITGFHTGLAGSQAGSLAGKSSSLQDSTSELSKRISSTLARHGIDETAKRNSYVDTYAANMGTGGKDSSKLSSGYSNGEYRCRFCD